MLRVQDLMTEDVVSVRPTTSIKDVARLLVERDISGAPVVEVDGRVIGVISEGDLIAKAQGPDAVERRPLSRIFGDSRATREQLARVLALTAGDAMTTPAVTSSPHTPVAEAAATMARRGIKRLPVVDGGRLVGILTRADVVRAFARDDLELAEAIRQDILETTMWLDPNAFEVNVSQGRATIRGHVERHSEADMIERMTAMIPGVTAVNAELRWEIDDRHLHVPAPDLVSPYQP